jgi:hypothetical protein
MSDAFQFDPYLFIVASIIVPLVVALAASVLAPYFAELWKIKKEREKTKWTQMHERFFTMLTNLPGFFALTQDEKKKEKFLEAYFHIFLYAPDDTIKKFNEALMSMGYQKPSPTVPDIAMQEAILAMRRALYGDTTLKSNDILFPVPAKTSS